MWWGRKESRWGNEYRVVRRVYGDGHVSFVVEKNTHRYGVWLAESEFETDELAAARADELFAALIARQYAATVVRQ